MDYELVVVWDDHTVNRWEYATRQDADRAGWYIMFLFFDHVLWYEVGLKER